MTKILICGAGSIGERHIKNLQYLGFKDFVLLRTKKKTLRTVKDNFLVETDLYKALEHKPDIAIICNPSHLHLKTAISCIKNDCHLFIEKPITHNRKGWTKFLELMKKKKKQVFVGYMMRFHPCILKMNSWVNEGRIGKVIHYRSKWGEYLPNWHPWENYKQSYAGKKEMGGGPALTLSHDIDLALLFCGKPKNVYGLINKESKLKISSDHIIDILIKFNNKSTANIHLNYLNNPPERKIEIIGTKGQIQFDYYKNEALLYVNGKKSKKMKLIDFDRNQLFLDEMKYFLKLVKDKKSITSNIANAFQVADIALNAGN